MIYIAMSALALMNLITAVVVDAAHKETSEVVVKRRCRRVEVI